MPGAGRIAAEAALRSGAGKTTWVTTREAYRVMGRAIPEVMALTFPSERMGGGLPRSSVKSILRRTAASATAVAVGPGLGRGGVTRHLVRSLLRHCRVPLILDADALWAIEKSPQILAQAACPVILTPHQGELSRLFGAERVSVAQAEKGRVANWITNQYHCVLVWKGQRTLVADAARRIFVNRTGNPGLAKGGSGDALTGMIAALAAQSFAPYDAARIGVNAHGRAADLAVRSVGITALTASDVLKRLPAVWRELEKRKDLRHF